MAKPKIPRSDPETYKQLSAPYPNLDAANVAFEAFCAEVYEARKRHGIPDVVVTACVNVTDPNGKGVGQALSTFCAGDSALAPLLSAHGFNHYRNALVATLDAIAKAEPK